MAEEMLNNKDPKEIAKVCETRLGHLKTDRQEWEAYWKLISQYLLPRRGYFFDQDLPNDGRRRDQKVVDGLATRAARILAAGMQGGLTSPSRPWFRLTLDDKDLAKYPLVKDWLDAVENVLRGAFHASNFYNSIHSYYMELGGFATGCMTFEEGFDQPFRFRTMTTGEYYLETDDTGRIDTMYREIMFSVKHLYEKFGADACNQDEGLKTLFKDDPFEKKKVIHAVEPNDDMIKGRWDRRNKKWRSIYFLDGRPDVVLRIGGFDTFTPICGRWDVTGFDVYGRGPGMEALGDIMMLQEKSKTRQRAEHYQTLPPMQADPQFKHAINLMPGGFTWGPTDQQNQIRALFQANLNLQHNLEGIRDIRQALREAFFNDLFLMVSGGPSNMTATEVLEKHEEKLLMLGPVIERQMNETLTPIITRGLDILAAQGKLPSLPPDLAERVSEYQIEYISLLAQAQKMAGMRGMDQYFGFVGRLAQGQAAVQPGQAPVLDKVDFDAAADAAADMLGIPAPITRADEEVTMIRQRRQEEQQRIMEMQQKQQEAMAQGEGIRQEAEAMKGVETATRAAKGAVDAAKQLSETDLEGLRQVIGGLSG